MRYNFSSIRAPLTKINTGRGALFCFIRRRLLGIVTKLLIEENVTTGEEKTTARKIER